MKTFLAGVWALVRGTALLVASLYGFWLMAHWSDMEKTLRGPSGVVMAPIQVASIMIACLSVGFAVTTSFRSLSRMNRITWLVFWWKTKELLGVAGGCFLGLAVLGAPAYGFWVIAHWPQIERTPDVWWAWIVVPIQLGCAALACWAVLIGIAGWIQFTALRLDWKHPLPADRRWSAHANPCLFCGTKEEEVKDRLTNAPPGRT